MPEPYNDAAVVNRVLIVVSQDCDACGSARMTASLASGLTGLIIATVPIVGAITAFFLGDRSALQPARVVGNKVTARFAHVWRAYSSVFYSLVV